MSNHDYGGMGHLSIWKSTKVFYNQNNVADLDFFNFTYNIWQKKKSFIIFGNVTILNAPGGFKLMTNALTHCSTLLGNYFRKEKKTWFVCLFWYEVRQDIKLSHTTFIIKIKHWSIYFYGKFSLKRVLYI